MLTVLAAYAGLFASAFLAATLLPLGSEVVLSTLLLNTYSVALIVIVATVGNVLGSLVNYYIGAKLGKPAILRFTNTSEAEFEGAAQRFNRYGKVSLCFAWVPIIGDPLTLVAGVLRMSLTWFLVLVTVGKLGRYIMLACLVLSTVD
jgi:membrane protein YqaA with SNARE-associated domain